MREAQAIEKALHEKAPLKDCKEACQETGIETNLSILLLNTRSIQSHKKKMQAKALLQDRNPDIIIFTETWLKEKVDLGIKSHYTMVT